MSKDSKIDRTLERAERIMDRSWVDGDQYDSMVELVHLVRSLRAELAQAKVALGEQHR